MRRFQIILQACSILGLVLVANSLALAQATRTWVSGVGDDANPCSRTAPCKTFAGAISKTAAGGEINVLDPGGFGAVTITKSITIDGSGGSIAGVLAAGTNGIIVNAGATDKVTIRNLDINGIGTGLNGVRFLAGESLHIERCQIYNFAQKGVSCEPSGASELYMRDCYIRNNGGTDAVNGGGVLIKPVAPGILRGSADNVRFDNNIYGLRAQDRTNITINNCSAVGNSFQGFMAFSEAGGSIKMKLESCIVSGNGNTAIRSTVAAATPGGSAVIHISNVTCVDNLIDGLSVGGVGQIISYGNNRIAGNAPNGSPTSTIPQQ